MVNTYLLMKVLGRRAQACPWQVKMKRPIRKGKENMG